MSPALIFDLDGTIADTAPDLLAATNEVLRVRGRPAIDSVSLRHMVGFGARSLIVQAMAGTGAPATEAELPGLVDIFLDHYRVHIADRTMLFPGVEETLAELKSGGARLGILTNKPQALTDLLLPRLRIEGYFGAIYGAGRKPYTKPDARIFHDVVGDLGGDLGGGHGGRAVMIGDLATDVQTARAAGAPVILVSYGYTPRPAGELGGDLVIDAFGELPAALARLAL